MRQVSSRTERDMAGRTGVDGAPEFCATITSGANVEEVISGATHHEVQTRKVGDARHGLRRLTRAVPGETGAEALLNDCGTA